MRPALRDPAQAASQSRVWAEGKRQSDTGQEMRDSDGEEGADCWSGG